MSAGVPLIALPPTRTTSPPLTNQSSQHKRGQLLENDGVARLVSFKNLSEEKTDGGVSHNVGYSVCEQLPCRLISLPCEAAASARRPPTCRPPPAPCVPRREFSLSSALRSEPRSSPPGSERQTQSAADETQRSPGYHKSLRRTEAIRTSLKTAPR